VIVVTSDKVDAHTPGPWTYNTDFGEIQAESGIKTVAVISVHSGRESIGDSELESNARLIAAAPTMKALLEKLLDTALPATVLRVPPYIVEAMKDVLRQIDS
jgi:hypothetical protein